MIPNNIQDLEKIKHECQKVVNRRSSASAVVAVVPLPGVDVGADILLLMEMLSKINKRFGLDHEQINELDASTKKQIFVIISSIGSQAVGKVVTKEIVVTILKKIGIRVTTKQIAKYIPIIGQIFSASISFTAMKLVGREHINDCYNIVKQHIEDNKK